jgi:hypothetical protein
METITLKYDDKDTIVKKALDLLLSLNNVSAERQKKDTRKSSIERSLDDYRNGNVHRLITPKKVVCRKK